MLGFAILLGFHFLGLLCQKWLHVPIPANVIGLMLFTASLFLGWIRVEWVEGAARFLLKHMMLFFAPIVVAGMTFFPMLREEWSTVLVSLVGSTLVSLFAAGWTVRGLTKEEARRADIPRL
jgi:holin-like protein